MYTWAFQKGFHVAMSAVLLMSLCVVNITVCCKYHCVL